MAEQGGTIFEWDDSAERSGLNRLTVTRTDAFGGLLFHVSHAGTATVVGLPRYAVEGLRECLDAHLSDSQPDAIVRQAIASNTSADVDACAKRVMAALREARMFE